MRVLHVCSDFAKRRLYSELVESLEHNGVSEQFVYVPVRSDEEIDRNRNKSLQNTQYRITRILGKHHRLLFRRKIATVFSDLDANVEAARFSFLLSIPAVAGAGVLIIPEIMDVGGELVTEALITGAMTFVAALATMHFLMRFLSKASMMIFVVYRVLLGIILLAIF